jgi:hypothetical protein
MEDKKKHTCCSIEGCTKAGKIQNGVEKFIRGLCHAHYKKLIKYGDAQEPLKRCPNGNDITKHLLYKTWRNIIARTSNRKHTYYHNYGERGIEVCARWRGIDGFLNFIEDVGEKPSTNHTLDRIDNDGNYEPGNVKWSTRFEQAANRRNNCSCVGVNYIESSGMWRAGIKINYIYHNLGNHETFERAVAARKAAEVKYGIVYSNSKLEGSLQE